MAGMVVRAALAAGWLLGSGTAFAADFFRPLDGPTPRLVQPPHTVTQRFVRLDPDALARSLVPTGADATARAAAAQVLAPTLDLDLVPGLKARIRRAEVKAVRGLVVWSGDVAGGGDAVFVLRDGHLTGHVAAAGRIFRMDRIDGDVYRITELDLARRPRDLHVDVHNTAAATDATPAERANGTTVDVLIAYTKKAQAATQDIELDAMRAVELTNKGYKSSGVPIHMRLVDIIPAGTYDEDKRTYDQNLTDLRRGKSLTSVRDRRETSGSDLVILMREGGSACGIAYVVTKPDATTSSYGFSVISRNCIDYYVLGHETGHNMGLYHDRFVEADKPKNAYSYGYVNLNAKIRDIMSYPNLCQSKSITCSLINQYSSPIHSYFGKTFGVEADKPNAADGARSLNENRFGAADYRPSKI